MNKKKSNPFLVIAIVVVLIVAITQFISMAIKIKRIQAESEATIKKLDKVKFENEKLKGVLKDIDSADISDKDARERLNKIKAGEIPVINSKPNN